MKISDKLKKIVLADEERGLVFLFNAKDISSSKNLVLYVL